MNKKIFFLLFFMIAVQIFLSAQTADEIEKLLGTENLSYGQAAGFIFRAADIAGSDDPSVFMDPEEAFRVAGERRWLPEGAGFDASARLDCVSLLLMRSFGIRGGLFYSLFKNPHYAYRELVYHEIIHGRAEPKMTVSGEMLLYMVNRIYTVQEDQL